MKAFWAAALICALATPAAAHAFLKHADPGAGASVKPAPREVALQFTEDLEASFSGLEVTDAAGRSVESAPATIAGSAMRAPLKPLAPGPYHVKWRAVSVDSHRTEGQFTFTVQP